MDRDEHRRFLNYLETFPYFNSASKPRLSREDWLELDHELKSLRALGREIDDEQARRLRAIAKALLVD